MTDALRVMGSRCGDCAHLRGAGCCAVWLYSVRTSKSDASECHTFTPRKSDPADIISVAIDAAERGRE